MAKRAKMSIFEGRVSSVLKDVGGSSTSRKPNSEHEEGRAKASKRPELVDLPAPQIKLTKKYLSGPPGS